MQHRYPYFAALAADYTCADDVNDASVLSVTVSEDELAEERRLLGATASDGYVESQAIQRAVARMLAVRGVFHMHAVAVAVDGEAYVFLAESGVGKTTHVAEWLTLLGDRARVVCDDKPFFSFEGDALTVHGSPWTGKERMGKNISVPVKAFCILYRGAQNMISPAAPHAASEELLRRVFIPEDPAAAVTILTLADRVLSRVPFWSLQCTPSSNAAEVAYNAMSKKE